jgi:hypothetical protein
MLEELNIKDDNEFPNFVRVEMVPKDRDVFNHNLENWILHVDQDFLPDWFDVEKVEKEMKIKMEEVFEKCFAIDSQDWKEYRDTKIYVKNSKIRTFNSSVVARYNSSVVARYNSSVVARYNSSVVAWDNSSVVAWDNSSVVAWDNSSVVARGNSSVEARDNSSVEARDNSSVVAWDNSSVVARGNSSVVIPYSKKINIKSVSENATIKDLSGNKPKLIIANDFDIVNLKNKGE